MKQGAVRLIATRSYAFTVRGANRRIMSTGSRLEARRGGSFVVTPSDSFVGDGG